MNRPGHHRTRRERLHSILNSLDVEVLALNRQAYRLLRCEKQLTVVDGATHRFEEPGTWMTSRVWRHHGSAGISGRNMGDPTETPTGPVDLERALLDPAAVFSTPEEVLARADLPHAVKTDVLRRWAYDTNEVAVAEEEGMLGEDNDLQRRVLLALLRLTGRIQQTAPIKQHGDA